MRERHAFNEQDPQLRNRASSVSRRAILLLVVLALACCTGLAIGVWAHNRGGSNTGRFTAAVARSPQSAAQPTVPAAGGALTHMDVEVITIRPIGFERSEIKRPKGRFGIAVENRSGLREVALRLDQEGGPRLRSVLVSGGKLNWKEAFDLPPGRYILTEANNPDWVCHITITE